MLYLYMCAAIIHCQNNLSSTRRQFDLGTRSHRCLRCNLMLYYESTFLMKCGITLEGSGYNHYKLMLIR